jgi:hypothetical protein
MTAIGGPGFLGELLIEIIIGLITRAAFTSFLRYRTYRRPFLGFLSQDLFDATRAMTPNLLVVSSKRAALRSCVTLPARSAHSPAAV